MPLLGAPTVTKFRTVYFVSQLSTICLPISDPWLRPSMLNYLYPNIGCSLIFLQASFTWLLIVVINDVMSPLPISIHSTWPLVPWWTYSTRFVNNTSVHTCLIPWKITVGVGSSYGPCLGFYMYPIFPLFLDFFSILANTFYWRDGASLSSCSCSC